MGWGKVISLGSSVLFLYPNLRVISYWLRSFQGTVVKDVFGGQVMKKMLLLVTHGTMLLIGFATGIYLLPILTQPPAPDDQMVGRVASQALFTGQFQPDLKGSDALHYGDGTLYVSNVMISFSGSISPGPDYRLYLSPQFVETKADFLAKKSVMKQVGEVKTFDNFIVTLPDDIDPAVYNTAIVWCEAFGIFITAGKYQ